ncbi:MAG: hypothetical protein JO049_10625 [Hyphomicrobiales bacterium]|jgi:uncharacterized protein|nr:hypothetical protein [Hyphomicrobiales bacterium]
MRRMTSFVLAAITAIFVLAGFALGLSFTVATVALATTLVQDGALQISIAGASVAALAPALLGMVLGQWLRARTRSETFRVCFFVGSLLLGAHLALRGLI